MVKGLGQVCCKISACDIIKGYRDREQNISVVTTDSSFIRHVLCTTFCKNLHIIKKFNL